MPLVPWPRFLLPAAVPISPAAMHARLCLTQKSLGSHLPLCRWPVASQQWMAVMGHKTPALLLQVGVTWCYNSRSNLLLGSGWSHIVICAPSFVQLLPLRYPALFKPWRTSPESCPRIHHLCNARLSFQETRFKFRRWLELLMFYLC